MKLHEMCREARLRANISLRTAAFEMGYSPSAVSRFERGEIYRINPGMLLWYKENTDAFNGKDVIYFDSKTVS